MMTAIEPHTLAQQNRTLAYELGLSDGSRHMKGTKLTIREQERRSAWAGWRDGFRQAIRKERT